MGIREVSIQFSGGKDSTLLALLMMREFDRVNLLAFSQPLIVDLEKIRVNLGKLKDAFGEKKFTFSVLDIEELLKTIYSGTYWRDLVKYKTYGANNFCGACRLAMISHTIIHCLKHNIHYARDGSNATGFDLSQQNWALSMIREFYRDFGIDYQTPVYDVRRSDVELLSLGLSAPKPVIFYRSQPRCRGGGAFHNIYLRCYFLPVHGGGAYEEVGREWLRDKLEVCREYIRKVCCV